MPWHDPSLDADLLAGRAPWCRCTAQQIAEIGCDCEPPESDPDLSDFVTGCRDDFRRAAGLVPATPSL